MGGKIVRVVVDVQQRLPQHHAALAAVVVLVWLIQGGVAAVVGALTRRLGGLHGVLAACVTTGLAAGGLSGWPLLRGREMAAEGTMLLWTLMVTGGLPLALLAAWLAAWIRTCVRARGVSGSTETETSRRKPVPA
jgi:hypothetical protein